MVKSPLSYLQYKKRNFDLKEKTHFLFLFKNKRLFQGLKGQENFEGKEKKKRRANASILE